MKRLLVILFCVVIGVSAFAQTDRNAFDKPIDANAGIYSGGDILAPTSAIQAKSGLLYGLVVEDATDTNRVTLGDTGTALLTLYVSTAGGVTTLNIASATNIPLLIHGAGKQVQIKSGAEIRDGTTLIRQQLQVLDGPIQIQPATGVAQGLALLQSLTGSTGGKVWVDPSTKIVNFKNDMAGGDGFAFDPPLSSDDVTVYAADITVSATDTQTLTDFISAAIYSIAWDRLVDSASTTTIAEFVSGATDYVMNHFELIVDATGTTLPTYIENRITARTGSYANLVLSGTTTADIIVANSITTTALSSTGTTAFSGTITFASGSTIIGLPTMDVDLTTFDSRLTDVEALAAQNYDDIRALEVTVNNLNPTQNYSSVSFYVRAGETSYSFEHNLNTRDFIPDVRDFSTQERVFAPITYPDLNTVALTFSSPLAEDLELRLIESDAAVLVGDGSITEPTADPNLNTTDLLVSLRETAGNYAVVVADYNVVSSDEVKWYFAAAPTSGQYTAVFKVADVTATIGDAANTEITTVHGYSSRNLYSDMRATSGGEFAAGSLEYTDLNQATNRFLSAPASGLYTVFFYGLSSDPVELSDLYLALNASNGDVASGTHFNASVDLEARRLGVDIISATGTITAATFAGDGSNLTGLTAENLAPGTVSTIEFGYIDGATGAIQTQINSVHSTAASNLATHEADTSTHGVSTVAGISETQVLTNKTVSADSNTITNIENADIKAAAGIDAAKIGANTNISNTEYNYLDGLTANIQTQINSATTSAASTLAAHEADTSTHGVSTIAGISETQTLTNKTISADSNTITNIENADIKSGASIDAAKLHDGTVSNTEFKYLDGVTSALQTQLTNTNTAITTAVSTHAGLSHTHNVGTIVGATETQALTNKTGAISQWTNDSGYITDGNTNWDNTAGYITDGNTNWDNSYGYITEGNSGWDNTYGFITDGNTGWDNSYGFITDANDSVSASELEVALSGLTAGILIRSASGTFESTANNSANWTTAYTDRLKWDGGATGLTAATGRTSLGLGSAATATTATSVSNGATTLPDGNAVYDFVTGLGYITDGNTGWDNSYGYITDGNSGWDNLYGYITDANDTVSGTELDGTFSTNGLLKRTDVGTYSTVTDGSSNWDTAYNERLTAYTAPMSKTSTTLAMLYDSSDFGINGSLQLYIKDDSHTHDARYFTESESNTNFISVISSPVAGGFSTMTAGGELQTSAYSPSSFALASDLTSHTGNTGNPHSVTHTQVGSSVANWNANKLTGSAVSTNAPSLNQVLKWNGTSWTPSADTDTGLTSAFVTLGIYDGASNSASGSDAFYFTGGGGIGLSLTDDTLTISASTSSALWNANKLQGTTVPAPSGTNTFLKYDGASLSWSTGAGGVTDHGALTGLSDNDHPQYLLASGGTAMTGDLNLGGNDLIIWDQTASGYEDDDVGLSINATQDLEIYSFDHIYYKADSDGSGGGAHYFYVGANRKAYIDSSGLTFDLNNDVFFTSALTMGGDYGAGYIAISVGGSVRYIHLDSAP